MALDGARLGPSVDCALDAGHGGVPCLVNLTGFELDLDYLPALFFSKKKKKERADNVNVEGGKIP